MGKPVESGAERYDQLAMTFPDREYSLTAIDGGGQASFSPSLYQALVDETIAGKPVIFRSASLAYSLIGLAGEVGEARQLVLGQAQEQLSEAVKIEIGDELGDICWYLSQTVSALDLELDQIFKTAAQIAGQQVPIWKTTSIAEFQALVEESAELNSPDSLSQAYLAFNDRSDGLFNQIKKLNRDHELQLGQPELDQLTTTLANIIISLSQVASVGGIDLEKHVTKANIIKLAGRYSIDSQLIADHLGDELDAYHQALLTG